LTLKLRSLFFEVIRYSFVGLSAVALDTVVLVIFKELILRRYGSTGTIISTGVGFAAGTVYNYIFSGIFVFKGALKKFRGRQFRPFMTFVLIGLVGLGLTELGMLAGISLFGDRFYLAVKVAVAALVFIWNYSVRRSIIYR
jgi:putative flippase GtrA